MNKLATIYYKALEEVIEERKMLWSQAEEISTMMLDSIKLKADQFNHSATRKIEFINSELEKSASYLDNPSTQTFLKVIEIQDARPFLEKIKAELEEQTEASLKFKVETYLYTILNISFNEAEKLVEEAFDNPDKMVKEIKISVVQVWAFHMYCRVLNGAKKKLTQTLLVQSDKDPEVGASVKSDGLTNAQQVLMISLLNKVNKINKSQDAKSLNIFIHALTGKSIDDIKKFASRADHNKFLISTSPKQNIIDLNAVRPFFEKLMQEQILDIIDKAIASANSKILSSDK